MTLNMTMTRTIRRFGCFFMGFAAVAAVPCTSASTGDFYPSYEAKIVGHVVLSGNPARQMLLQQTGRKEYLYVKQASQPGFTVIDVTKPTKPQVVNHISQRDLTIVNPGLAIAVSPEKASAGSSQDPRSASPNTQSRATAETVRVLNLSNPAKPRTVETFNGVTSMARDDGRKLIFVANHDGIWILSHQTVLRRHECSSSDAISSAIPNCD